MYVAAVDVHGLDAENVLGLFLQIPKDKIQSFGLASARDAATTSGAAAKGDGDKSTSEASAGKDLVGKALAGKDLSLEPIMFCGLMF